MHWIHQLCSASPAVHSSVLLSLVIWILLGWSAGFKIVFFRAVSYAEIDLQNLCICKAYISPLNFSLVEDAK